VPSLVEIESRDLQHRQHSFWVSH